MMYPIVIHGEWLQLAYEEADDRKTALINAANKWVEMANKELDEDYKLRIDPLGPTGECTPNLTIKVQRPKLVRNKEIGERWFPELGIPYYVVDGWETESTWTLPVTEQLI